MGRGSNGLAIGACAVIVCLLIITGVVVGIVLGLKAQKGHAKPDVNPTTTLIPHTMVMHLKIPCYNELTKP
ncbi:unnamed protein product [Adineta ricciae]|uniref:Uncharacterized protein n=1 Tax=Adineta ricciae TaxID=249248 RepID=A0A815YHY6_ADIRI|nr:unnamed protein product [Adineta ricciae]CAF1571951.1 unnamed protein product [Adineta ricciae]